MKSLEKKIAVVIPTHNRRKQLKQVLLNLEEQKLPKGFSLKIIVVVDGSNDGTLEMLGSDFQHVDIIQGPGSWWFTTSLNHGCRRAALLQANYILTLNDDCFFENKMILHLLQAYNEFDGFGAVGAATLIKSDEYRVTFSGAKRFIKWRSKFVPYLDNRKEYNIEQINGTYPTYSLMTRGLFFPTVIGEEISFFDQKNFPQYGSDDDFTLRLIKKGYPCYVSWDAKIYDNPLLTSVGSAITSPSLSSFIGSFFNKYSVNSLVKTIRFRKRHSYWFLLLLTLPLSFFGALYAFFWKYKEIKL